MPVHQNTPALLEMRPRHRLSPRLFHIERSRVQHNALPVKRAIALPDGHRRLPRIEPHRCELIRPGIKAGDSRSRALAAIRLEEREVRLQKSPVLNHVLPARTLRHTGRARGREKRLHHVPIARELCQQFLTRAWRICRFIFSVSLLPDRRGREKQNRWYPLCHGNRLYATQVTNHATRVPSLILSPQPYP